MKSLIRIHNTGFAFAQVTTETEAIFMQIFPRQSAAFIAALWNRNNFYGSGSDFWKVMVLVPTFEKLRFRFQLHI